ncbi:hypothetical protein [Altererythrobacter sp. ZODW24]|uniref:CBU_0592 family membrane protein n=1 Tax=Altererythrobacter sp. ZODW24 TaxID=2185142 RepID=UPI000DF7D7C4|nr:hypothetical protein [Altererythrobacter sp. ZODW24]
MNAYISSFTADLIGFAGMFCIVSAFAYSNVAKVMNMILFNLTNLLGAILLTISLLVNYNLPTLVLEIVWMGIALFGLAKEFKRRRQVAT